MTDSRHLWHEFNMLANALRICEEWSRMLTLLAFEEKLLLLFSEFGRLLADRALQLNRAVLLTLQAEEEVGICIADL
jgi:hypothetical protein